jgi:hypothetical protein
MPLKDLPAAFCLAALLTSSSYAAESTYDYEIVAQSGTKIDGIALTIFEEVALNDANTVFFNAHYNDGSYAGATGIFSRKHALLKKGDVVAGAAINGPSLRSLNNFNEILVELSYPQTLASSLGKFTVRDNHLVLEGKLIRTGDVIGGLTIQEFRESLINDLGEIVFSADYTDASGASAIGVFTRNRVLLKAGSVVDGVSLSGNNTFGRLYGLSDFDTIAFDTNGNLGNLGGIQTGAFTQHKALALPNQTIHGIPLITAFSPAISHFGWTAFAGEYSIAPGCNSFLCRGFAVFGPRGVVARTGDSISGLTLNDSMEPVSINDEGEVLIQADVAGGYGLFTRDAVVAVTGDKLAGFMVEGFVNAQMNDSGNVAFSASEGILLARRRPDCTTHH